VEGRKNCHYPHDSARGSREGGLETAKKEQELLLLTLDIKSTLLGHKRRTKKRGKKHEGDP